MRASARFLTALILAAAAGPALSPAAGQQTPPQVQEFAVAGNHPHDVAPASDGGVWYTSQFTGELGHLDPATGRSRLIKLGEGSSPHGVVTGPDGAAWVTDQGLNAIVRVDGRTGAVRVFRIGDRNISAHTPAFDRGGMLWFTGQRGFYGRLDPASGRIQLFDAPRGSGPYGIAAAPSGEVWFASLAQSYIARINPADGQVTVFEPPTARQGARRVWPDSKNRVWVSEWNSGNLSMFDPGASRWRAWKLPGARPQAYAVYVDERDMVWVTDFQGDANRIVRFDPATERFETFTLSRNAQVRQLLGRPGEVWGAESGTNKLVVIRTR